MTGAEESVVLIELHFDIIYNVYSNYLILFLYIAEVLYLEVLLFAFFLNPTIKSSA